MININPFKKKCLRAPTGPIITPLTMSLTVGDVILSRSRGAFMSSLICEYTGSPYSHAEIYVGDGWCIGAESYGVTYSKRFQTKFIDVYRHLGLTASQKVMILKHVHSLLEKPYEYDLILSYPWLSRHKAIERARNNAYICSELVASCYKKAHLELNAGTTDSTESPADIARSKRLRYMTTWHSGDMVKDAHPHEWHHRQPRPPWYVRALVAFINRKK